MNNYYLKIETTTGEHIYDPSEWSGNFDTGKNFLVVQLLNNRNDMYSLNHVISVQQSEIGVFSR